MPVTNVTSPSGQIIPVTHPEGATRAEIIEFAKTRSAPEAIPRSMEDFSAARRFAYEFKSSSNLTSNIATLLEAALPVPNEKYGPQFDELPFNDRVQAIREFNQAKIKADYPLISALAEQGVDTGFAGSAGGFIKALADPTNLIPVGRGIKTVAAISGLLGGAFEASRGLVEEGEIDAAMTAKTAVGGAVLGAAADKAIRAVKPAYNRMRAAMRAKKTAKDVRAANIEMEKINSKMIELQANQDIAADSNPVLAAMTRLKIKPQDGLKIINNATERLDIPEPELAKVAEEYRKVLEREAVPSGFVADLLGSISTQVKKISPVAYQALQKFESGKAIRVGTYMKQIQGFEKLQKALPAEQREDYAVMLANRNYEGAIKLLKQYDITKVKTGLRKYRTTDDIMASVQAVLEEIQGLRLGADADAGELANFFPRINKDVDSTRQALGLTSKENSKIEAMLQRKADELEKEVSELTELQRSNVFDDFLKSRMPPIKDPKGKRRTIADLDNDLIQYYENPAEALTKYISRTTDEIELKRFFSQGKTNKIVNPEMNMDRSIGNYVQELYDDGEITETGMRELRKYLDARLGVGTRSPHRVLSALKSVSNAILLGNPISATTQLGDLFVAAHRYGIKNTFSSIAKGVTGRGDINVETMGLENYIATDLSDSTKAGYFLDKALTFSGFRAMDRLGKNTALEAGFKMNRNLAKTDAGIAKLRDKWGDVFGDEFDSLVSNLKAGKVTDNVKLLMWHELSSHQPISLSEMPLKYLENPNGRVFYALKSFTIKQLDMLRRSVADEYAKGNKLQAGKNLASYVALVGLGGATVQEIRNAEMGRGFDLERIPDNFVNQLLATFMASRYIVDNKLMEGDIMGALVEMGAPPTTALENLGKDAFAVTAALLKGEEPPIKAIRSVPLAGNSVYNLLGGGAEEFLERQAKD